MTDVTDASNAIKYGEEAANADHITDTSELTRIGPLEEKVASEKKT